MCMPPPPTLVVVPSSSPFSSPRVWCIVVLSLVGLRIPQTVSREMEKGDTQLILASWTLLEEDATACVGPPDTGNVRKPSLLLL